MKIKLLLLAFLLFGFFGCSQKVEDELQKTEIEPLLSYSCMVSSFLEGVSMYSNDNNTYIIKGIVSNKTETGLNIRLVEDLKGNFPKNVNTFFVWGGANTFIESHILDNLLMYNKQDALIMHLTPALVLPAEMIPEGHTWLGKQGDYSPLNCAYSVVKLSDDYVTGYIFSAKISDDRREDSLLSEEQTSHMETANIPRIESASLSENDKAILDQHLSKYTAFTIDGKEMAGYFSEGSGCIRLQIDKDFDLTICLELNDLRAPDYRAYYTNEEGTFEVNEPFVVNTFKGETSAGQHVRATIDENTFFVYIFGEKYSYIIQPTKDFTQNKEDKSFIAYKSWDVIVSAPVMGTMLYDDFQKELNELLTE